MPDPLQDLLTGIGSQLTGGVKTALKDRAEQDPFFWARDIMGNEAVFPERLTDEEAGDWVKLFEYIYSFGKPGGVVNGVLNSSRNTLKTTLLAGLMARFIGRDRNIRIYYCTNVHSLSLEMSRAVQHQLAHNEKIHEIYGRFEPEGAKQSVARGEDDDANWTQAHWTVKGRTKYLKEPTFTAGSVGKTAVGNHFDIIILDDCVDYENTKTAESINALIEWFKLVRSLRDKKSTYGPGGCTLVVGTRYEDGDLYGYLLGEVSDDKDQLWRQFTPLVLRAVENPECWSEVEQRFLDPVLNFPHILTEDIVNDERRGGAYHFSMQYQNECVPPGEAHFKREWFPVINAYDVPQGLRYYIFTDFAFGLDDANDRTALWTVGLDWERKAYCVDFDVGRWSLNERCTRTVDYAQKYDVSKIAIEQVVSNEGVKATIERLRDQRRLKFSIQEIGGRSTETKKLRITSLQPRFEQRRIFFVLRDSLDMIGIRKQFLPIAEDGMPAKTGEILREFLRFPKATHDDIPDALSDIDKIDQQTRTYYFGGCGRMASPQQMYGPTVVNGRVLFTEDFGLRRHTNATQTQQTGGNFWGRAAARFRGR
uniref:Putative terminase n=1 Tax=viral metagenome TaxID=1070528 RepID=A0A6M3K7M0_9ZZZZ